MSDDKTEAAINFASAVETYLAALAKEQTNVDREAVEDMVVEQLNEHDFTEDVQNAVDNHDFSEVVDVAVSDAVDNAVDNVDVGSQIEDYFYYNTAPVDEDAIAQLVERLQFETQIKILQGMEGWDRWLDDNHSYAVSQYKSKLAAEKAEQDKAKECQSVE